MEYVSLFFITALVIIVVSIVVLSKQANKNNVKRLLFSYGKESIDIDYELDSIKLYSDFMNDNNNELRVDDITWNDLSMDLIFKRINACITSVGEEYLYNCLKELQFNENLLSEREELIEFFSSNPEERLKTQLCLLKIGKANYNGIVALIKNQEIGLFKYPYVYKVLAVAPLLCALTLFYDITIGIGIVIISFIINLIIYLFSKRKINFEIPAIGYFASLLYGCNKLCKTNGINTLPIIMQLRKRYEIFKSLRGSLPVARVFAGDIIETAKEYFNILFLVDIRNYNNFVKKIDANREDFHALYKTIGEIDLALCISSFRKSLPIFSKPEFHAQNSVEFEEIYHPLINSPVTNTGVISKNSLITGSNASGKSTFIKALAINGILAQTIHTCAAQKFKARFSLIITSMALRDDISGGDSYFIVEIASLKRILDLCKKYPCACYIDEILRGTNTIERIASSASVLRYLSSQDCLCAAASHDIELTKITEDAFDNYHFCEQATDEGILFDYKLKHGASVSRNAIKLLSYMGFNPQIVESAVKLASEYDKNNAW